VKRVAADAWRTMLTTAERREVALADINGLAMGRALERLSAETKAWCKRVRHETRGR
jgi:hypothetical protein